MKQIVLLFSCICLLGMHNYAQVAEYSNDSIAIYGEIWSSPNDTITVQYTFNPLGLIKTGSIVITTTTSNGKFHFNLPGKDTPYFITIKSARWGGLLLNDLIVEKGDQLIIQQTGPPPAIWVNSPKPFLQISGRNSGKNQLQFLWNYSFSHQTIPGFKMGYSSQVKNFAEYQKPNERFLMQQLQHFDSLVHSIKDPIPAHFLETLEMDIYAKHYTRQLAVFHDLFERYSVIPDSLFAFRKLLDEYYTLVNPLVEQWLKKYTITIYTPDFLDFAVRKTMADARVRHGKLGQIPAIDYLDFITQWPARYQQEVLTAMTAYFFVFNARVGDINEFTNKVLSLVHKPNLLNLLLKLQKNFAANAVLFPFILPNDKGEKIDVRKFADKVLVIDFWFTHCKPCITMAKVVKKLREQVKDNKDIVFISISVDKNKNRWLESIKTGLYTDDENINLYTEGLGFDHPLMIHYELRSCPKLFLVGKNNRLINANPNLPANKTTVEDFVSYLLEQINQKF